VVAVDSDGYVYLYGYDTVLGIGKFRINPDVEGDVAEMVAFKDYETLGLTYYDGVSYPLIINDLQVKSNRLYIAGSTNGGLGNYYGKIVEISTDDLSPNRDIGWSAETPTSTDALAFFGPTRFLAIAPRKLYLSDEGLFESSTEVDRVVEVDLDSGAISAVGQLGAVSFFIDYYAC